MSADKEIIELFVGEGLKQLTRWEEICFKLEKKYDRTLADELYRAAHNLKSGARLIEDNDLVQFCHLLEDLLKSLIEKNTIVAKSVTSLLLECETVLRSWLNSILHATALPLERLMLADKVSQFLAGSWVEPDAKKVFAVENRTQETSIRVATNKLEELNNTVRELAISQDLIFRLLKTAPADVESVAQQFDQQQKMIQRLQDTVLRLSMLPLSGLFARIERSVRDISEKLKKEVVIEFEGGDILLDRGVIDAIVDPLLHLIRNSVDHGIEPFETRIKNGKPQAGLVTVKAANSTDGIMISVIDDGKGIDPDFVYQKAIQKGLLTQDIKLNYKEKLDLIFLPGFSTIDHVTEFSGRGVGMDVVHNTVNKLGGEIRIDSVVGSGTTFELLVPSNLSLIHVMIIEISGVYYAVPIKDLVGVSEIENKNTIYFQKQEMTWHPLAQYLNVPNSNNCKFAIIFQHEQKLFAFGVDHILETREIFFRPASESKPFWPGYSGSATLTAGVPGMVINLHHLGQIVYVAS